MTDVTQSRQPSRYGDPDMQSRVSRLAKRRSIELEALPYLESLLLETEAEEVVISQYGDQLNAFYQLEKEKVSSWSEQVISRLSSIDNLHGSEHLVNALA